MTAQVTSFGTPVMTRATAGSVTGTWGTGQNRLAGELLVALVSAGGTTATAAAISTPAGWLQAAVPASNTPTTANAWVAVYWRVATGADAAPSFTATLTGTVAMTVTLFDLAGACNITPFDTWGFYASGAAAATLSAMAAPIQNGIATGIGEFAITCFAQEAAAAATAWNPGGGWTNAATDAGTSSVLHTAVDYQAGPAMSATLSETGHFTADTSAFGAGIIIVVGPNSGIIELFTNDASTTISAGGTGAPAAGTVESWTSSTSWAGFPAAMDTTVPFRFFHAADPAAPSELIAVLNTTAGRVVRGAEGTTPVAHTGGFTVRNVASAGSFSSSQLVYNVQSPQFGAKGDGVTDDTAAIQAAANSCVPGGTVYFPPGVYVTSYPIVISNRICLVGADSGQGYGIYGGGYPPGSRGTEELPEAGAVIRPSATWAQGPAVAAAVFLLIAPTHWITEGPIIRDLAISGVNLPVTADGIQGYGAVVNVLMDNVYVYKCTGWGINTAYDDLAPAGFAINSPGTWIIEKSMTWDNTAGGINLTACNDSTFLHVDCIGNTGDNWAISDCGNTKLIGCRAEWSATGYGYSIYDDAGPRITLIGCSTDNNGNDGIHLYGPGTGGQVNIVGCDLHADGHAGGGNTGANISYAAAYAVTITSTITETGNSAAGPDCPAYGIQVSGAAATGYVTVEGGLYHGVTAGITTDNSCPLRASGVTVADADGIAYYQYPFALSQAAAAQTVAGNGVTIATAGLGTVIVTTTAARSGAILQAGTVPGQVIKVLNQGAAANSITFAAAPGGNVADGASRPVAGLTGGTYVWDSLTSLWYRTG